MTMPRSSSLAPCSLETGTGQMLHNPAIPETPVHHAVPRTMAVIVLLSIVIHATVLLWPQQPARPVISETLLRLDLQQSPKVSSSRPVRQPASARQIPEPGKKRPPVQHRISRLPSVAPATHLFRQNRPVWRQTVNIDRTRRPATEPVNHTAAKPETTVKPRNVPRRLSLAERTSLAHKNLAHIFMKRFRYPLLATQRGWEGEVLLKVMIASNGQLEKVTVSESSGYTILDHSALATMQSIRILPGSDSILQHRQLTLSFNVRYQLTDN